MMDTLAGAHLTTHVPSPHSSHQPSAYIDMPSVTLLSSESGHFWELSEEIFVRINVVNRKDYVNFMQNNPRAARAKNISI